MEQDAMDATPWIGRDTQSIECDLEARAAQARVGGDVFDVVDRQRIASWRRGERSEVAEGVGGVLPGFVKERPPAFAVETLDFEGTGCLLLSFLEHSGGLVLPNLAQLDGSLSWRQSAQHRVIEPGVHMSAPCTFLISARRGEGVLEATLELLPPQSAFTLNRDYILFNAHSTTLHPLHTTKSRKASITGHNHARNEGRG